MKISRRLDDLAESGKSRVETDLNISALSQVTGRHLLHDHQKGISPFHPRIKEFYLPEVFAVKIKVSSLQEARDKHGLTALAATRRLTFEGGKQRPRRQQRFRESYEGHSEREAGDTFTRFHWKASRSVRA